MDFWQNVLAACAALLILIAIMGVVYAIYSAVKANKQKAYFAELHANLKVGQRVAFAGGLFGKLVRVGEETCDVEVKSGAVIEVSRYAIQEISKKKRALAQQVRPSAVKKEKPRHERGRERERGSKHG